MSCCVEVSGQACLCSLIFEAAQSGGVLGLGTGSCFGLIMVRVLTSLAKRPPLLTGLQTILVVQAEDLSAKPTLPVTHTSHTQIHSK